MPEKIVDKPLSAVELEIIGYIVSMAAIIRLPKSVGEIFGLLYISEDALTMDMVMQKLGISLGTASQGIKALRSFGAVRPVYIPGERREHYVAETDFRTLLNRFIKDEWRPKLEAATERLDWIESQVKSDGKERDQFILDKLKTLKRLNSRANLLFTPLSKIIEKR